MNVTDKFEITANYDGTYTVAFKDINAVTSLDTEQKYTVTAENISVRGIELADTKAVPFSITMSKPKIVQSTKEVKLYINDRYSRGEFRLSLSDVDMLGIKHIEAVDSKISAFYQLVDLGGGIYAIEYRNNTIAENIAAGTLKFNVYLEGNNPEHTSPNATVNIKIKNIKF